MEIGIAVSYFNFRPILPLSLPHILSPCIPSHYSSILYLNQCAHFPLYQALHLLLLTGFFSSLLFPLINFIISVCILIFFFFVFLLHFPHILLDWYLLLFSSFCQLHSATLQFFYPFYSFLMCWHFVLVSIIINQIIITPSLIHPFLQNACLLTPPSLSFSLLPSLHHMAPPSSFSFCFALSIFSLRYSTIFRLSQYLIKSSSSAPLLLYASMLHQGPHGDDSNAVTVAALSANWGNYYLASAVGPVLPFPHLPGSSSLLISFPLYYSIPPSSSSPPALPQVSAIPHCLPSNLHLILPLTPSFFLTFPLSSLSLFTTFVCSFPSFYFLFHFAKTVFYQFTYRCAAHLNVL